MSYPVHQSINVKAAVRIVTHGIIIMRDFRLSELCCCTRRFKSSGVFYIDR
jgi:hypothetical protein